MWYGNWRMIRQKATETKNPTPRPIMTRRKSLEMDGSTVATWLARTWTSGSATVMKKPMKKPVASMMGRFRLWTRAAPMACPMGRTPMSVPRRKTLNPRMMSTPPTMNCMRSIPPMGATVG